MLMLHIRQSIYLFLTNALSTSFLILHITFDEISTTLYSPGKRRCTWYMRSNDMFILLESHFCYFFEIENAVHTSFQNSMLLFINGLIFDIMNIQNNQSFEFEWIPLLAPLRSVNDRTFSLPHNVFLKSSQDCLNSVQQCIWSKSPDSFGNLSNYL